MAKSKPKARSVSRQQKGLKGVVAEVRPSKLGVIIADDGRRYHFVERSRKSFLSQRVSFDALGIDACNVKLLEATESENRETPIVAVAAAPRQAGIVTFVSFTGVGEIEADSGAMLTFDCTTQMDLLGRRVTFVVVSTEARDVRPEA